MIKKLNEDTALKFKTISPEEKEKKGILGRLYGNVASFAAPTRNGRRYDQSLWEQLFDSDLIKERFANGGIFGQLCHPDAEEVDMEKIACVMPEPPVKDSKGNLVAYVDLVDTPCGRIAYQLAKYGYKFGISSRGTGDIIYDDNGDEVVDPDTYQLNAFDLVEIPAVESARLQFVESLNTTKKYGKTLKQKLTEEINKASVEDKKIMKEALDNLDIKLDEKLIDPSEEDLAPIEAKFAELGLEIEGKGNTLSGNKHYQLRKELDHKVTKDDLGPIFDVLSDLGTDDMPTVCNVGVHRDGDNIISASVDVLKKYIDEQFYLNDGKIEQAKKEILGIADQHDLLDFLLQKADKNTVQELCRKYGIKSKELGVNILTPDELEAMYGVRDLKDLKNEELEDNDGWGDEISGELEQSFRSLEDLIYEVRNCVRGSYAVHGKEVKDLVKEIRERAEDLEMIADGFEEDEDRLNEAIGKNFINKLSNLNELASDLNNKLGDDYEPTADDEAAADNINKLLDNLKDLKHKLKESLNEDLSKGYDVEYYDQRDGWISASPWEFDDEAGCYDQKIFDSQEEAIKYAEDHPQIQRVAEVEYEAVRPGHVIWTDPNEAKVVWERDHVEDDVNESFYHERGDFFNDHHVGYTTSSAIRGVSELADRLIKNKKISDDDKAAVEFLKKMVDETIASLKSRGMMESVDSDCSDKEVSEDAGNTGLVDQLQEALTKSAQLEKDNLSLQEKLSVCNAKEVKLEEELSRLRKATASLSKSSKDTRELKESIDTLQKDLDKSNKELKQKDQLLESTRSELKNVKLKVRNQRVNEQVSIKESKGLEKKIANLTEQLNESVNKLNKMTSTAKNYKKAYLEAKSLYISAKAEAYGINEDSIRAQLKESYSIKDVDLVCDELAKEKANLSKLPFRINESTKLGLKTAGEYINGGRFMDDDIVSESLLRMLD